MPELIPARQVHFSHRGIAAAGWVLHFNEGTDMVEVNWSSGTGHLITQYLPLSSLLPASVAAALRLEFPRRPQARRQAG